MLKQIDRWDLVEEERVLTIEEGAERDTSVRELCGNFTEWRRFH